MRSFTIDSIKKTNGSSVKYVDGRFISDTPSAAARKVFSKAYHHINVKGPMTLKIAIQETTQGSLNKIYNYRVSKKNEKVDVEINGEIITYNFTTKIKSLN